MSKLTNLIKNLCPLGVEFKKLGEVSEVTKLAGFEFTKYVKYTDTGKIIAIRALNVKGNLDLNDVKYIDGSDFSKLSRSKLYENDILFTYVGTVGKVALIPEDDKYYLAPNVARIRFDTKKISPRYIFHYLQTSEFIKTQLDKFAKFSSMKNLTMENIRQFKIPIPPLEVQKEIVRILDKFTELIEKLSEELTLRKKQYEYYRDKLLTFGAEVEFKKLCEIAKFSTEKITAESLNEKNYIGVDNLLPDKKGKTFSEYVPKKGSFTKFFVGDILIGNIRPYLKKIWFADCEGGTNGDVLAIQIINKKIFLPKFLYYILSSDGFFFEYNSSAKGGKMPRGNKNFVMNYKIPIPPIEEQARIVKILDRFDKLCNDISEGLPAEISLRKKQYEFYRDELLTFEEKKVDFSAKK